MNWHVFWGFSLMIAGGLMAWSFPGLRVDYMPPFPRVGPGEFNLWVTHLTLWLPGAALIGYGMKERFEKTQSHFDSIESIAPHTERQVAVLTALILASFYRVARSFFLRDLPVTDEEYSTQFGGRILASGNWFAHLDVPYEQMPTLFLLERDGGWTSIDFFGIQLAWAFAEFTHTGPWIFSLVSAATVVGMYYLLKALTGSRKWGFFGAFLMAISPMATMLSLTTHAHILSRFFLVLFLLFWVRGSQENNRNFALAGLAWGFGMMSRPAETLTLTTPFLLFSLYEIVTRKRGPVDAVMFVLGVLPGLGLILLHNYNVSGTFWKTPRMVENTFLTNGAMAANSFAFLEEPLILLRRLVDNAIANVRSTILYWGGGLGLAALAFSKRSSHSLLLFVGLLLHFSVALLHDNDGVRSVGPIHYSEWVIHLTLLATLAIRSTDILQSKATALLAVATLSTLPMFVAMGLGVRTSNSWHDSMFTIIETSVPRNSVVMLPRNAYFWTLLPPGAYNRSWVFETRSPMPDLSDEVLLLRYTTGAESWAINRFPERTIFILRPIPEAPYYEFQPIR